MKTIRLTTADLMPGSDDLEGQPLDRRHWDRVVRDEAVTVLKPDGSGLLVYVPDAIPRSLCRLAWNVFETLPSDSHNRPTAAGGGPMRTGIAGFYDRDPRASFCRQTAFTQQHAAEFRRARRFIASISSLYRTFAPQAWARQRRFIDTVHPDFVIRDTVFTTLTVNDTQRTTAHRDDGDLRDGLGVMTAMARGKYAGFELVFPRFRTAVDMRTGGLCLADVHELHGNAPMVARTPTARRLSFIFYARARMSECGSLREENERAGQLV